jgi:hypothetical protein
MLYAIFIHLAATEYALPLLKCSVNMYMLMSVKVYQHMNVMLSLNGYDLINLCIHQLYLLSFATFDG